MTFIRIHYIISIELFQIFHGRMSRFKLYLPFPYLISKRKLTSEASFEI